MNNHSFSRFISAIFVASAAILNGANAFAADISHPTESVLSSGKWVKVRIPGDGICQISYDDLRSWGFSNPENVKVYGYGSYVLQHNKFLESENTDIYPTYFEHTNDNRIIFYGAASHPELRANLTDTRFRAETVASFYDTDNYYLLTDRNDRNFQPSQPLEFVESTYDKLLSHTHIEGEDIDKFNICEGGTIYHNRKLANGDNLSISFPIRDYVADENNAACLTAIICASSKQRPFTPDISISLPAEFTSSESQSLTCSSPSPNSSYYYYSVGQTYNIFSGQDNAIADGEYSFNISIPTNFNFSYLAYDRSHITYNRNNVVRDDEPWLIMNFTKASQRQVFGVTGLTQANARIWDITDVHSVRPYQVIYRTATATAEATFNNNYDLNAVRASSSLIASASRAIAFNINKTFPEAEFVAEIQNQNIHGDQIPDMVIVTTPEYLPYAQELADLHAQVDGITTNIYLQDQVFNEFSYGNRSAMGIRRLCKMFRDRSLQNPDGKQFRYLLMYGPANYDNRGAENPENRNSLICYEVDETYNNIYAPYDVNQNYYSDMYFAFLDSDFDPKTQTKFLPSIAVGRIPARTTVDAEIINKKIKDYVTSKPTLEAFGRALVFSDDGDRNKHLMQSVEIATALQAQTPITIFQPHDSFFQRQDGTNQLATSRIINALKKGVGYFNFTGHGNPRSFTAESIYDTNILNNNDYTTLPFAHLSTCYSVELDHNARHIGEAMVFKPNGGVIAITGACRAVFLEYNQALNMGMANAYANAAPGATIGDIWLNGNLDVMMQFNNSSSSDAPLYYANTLCYNLCGDPAIKLPIPAHHTVFIYSVNGEYVSLPGDDENISVTVNQLQPVELSGYVTKIGSTNIDTNFNGEVLIEIYETPSSKSVVVNDGDDIEESYTVDECLLSESRVKVKNGLFSVKTIMPMAYNGGNDCRIIMTAVNYNSPRDGRIGYSKAITLNVADSYDGSTQVTAPQITSMYIDGYEDGQDVPQDFNLSALITLGEGGLNAGNTLLAPGVRLILDKNKPVQSAQNYLTMNADGTASVYVPFTGITDGAHSLTLYANDKLNNITEHTISFIVRNVEATMALTADNDIARSEIQLSLQSDLSPAASVSESRLVITDADGKTVFTTQNPTFPYSWDLRNNNGNDLPDGRYNAILIKNVDNSYTSTPRLPITIIRPTVQ